MGSIGDSYDCERNGGVSGSGLTTLRVSWWDCGLKGSVGSAGVEQATDSVVSEVHKPERDPSESFRQIIDGFGPCVTYV